MFRRILHRLQDTPPYDDFAQSVPAMAPTIPPCTHNGRPRMLLHHPKRLKKNNNNNTVIDSTGTAHALGERLITLHTVRNSVDQASLWNTITMEVTSYFLFDLYNDKIEETYLSCRTSENENMGYAFNNNGNVNSKISISEYMEEKHKGRVLRLGGATENTATAAAAAASAVAAANAVNFILLSTNSESPTYTSGAAALRGYNTLPTRSNNHDYKIDNSMNVMCYWYMSLT
uniref:Uncharacterized protein n=1 Tax=Glossina palpalis gambiensis TaxID=67801 RepID=A0A1B0BSE7_9MUSC